VRDELAGNYGGVTFLPETFFINRDGKVTGKVFGLKSRSDIEDEVKKVLGTGTATSSGSTVAAPPGS